MSKISISKCKLCRREGEKLFLRGERCSTGKCAIVKKNYPPGMHGPKSRLRLTEYGKQLREKQKAKRLYGLRERQFRNIVKGAMEHKGETGEIILQVLEMRLDNVIYRLGLAASRRMARQLVNHSHFLVNNGSANIPSYYLQKGDTLSIKESHLRLRPFIDVAKKLEKYEIPAWLLWDLKKLQAKVLDKPFGKELKQNFDLKIIVEYYSK